MCASCGKRRRYLPAEILRAICPVGSNSLERAVGLEIGGPNESPDSPKLDKFAEKL